MTKCLKSDTMEVDMKSFISNKTYDKLKFVAQIVLPALATLYGTLAHIWNLPFASEIPLTIMAVDTFLGVLLGISKIKYDKENGDGE